MSLWPASDLAIKIAVATINPENPHAPTIFHQFSPWLPQMRYEGTCSPDANDIVTPKPPTFADIRDAAERIAPYAIETPLLENPLLNARAGGRVFIKPETLQRTGSFKFRGALNRLLLMPESDRQNGVVAYSSGNHAQGVAAAAGILGLPAVIVMPFDAPRAKVAGTKALGAEIVFYDRFKDDREAIAQRICEDRHATLVKPFDDPWVVAGQGTIRLGIARAGSRPRGAPGRRLPPPWRGGKG